MITKITSVQELKQIFLEILLNKTHKITDVSQESVLNGIAYGCAKVGQKLLVNQSVVEGHIFPDTAAGEYLDNLAAIRGVSPRFGAVGSSTYVRLTAAAGTYYDKDSIVLTATNGVRFTLDQSVTVDMNGFAYAKVSSESVGADTNVDPLTINRIAPEPQGHYNVTNEYTATGGRDAESDEVFRQRIKNSINLLSRNTIAYLEQVFMKINNRVLRIEKGIVEDDGRMNLTVVSVNGQDFTNAEFNEILNRSADFLSLSDVLRGGGDYALKLNNVNWMPIDVEFRVDIDPSYDTELVRRNIQIQMNKLFDYRFWKSDDKVEWDDLFYCVKQTDGVRYVPDNYFSPNSDVLVPQYRLPRIRGFIMRDLNGNIIEDNNGVMSEIYYPNEIDYDFQSSVLTTV